MKKSFRTKYHIMLMILFAMIILQSVLLLISADNANSLNSLRGSIQSIIIVFMFVMFIYVIVMYNYIPFRVDKALKDIQGLINEISDGNYTLDIDSTMYDSDKSIAEMVSSLKKMLNIIVRFDQLKADKIYEHNQRIQQLINLLPEMVVILSANAETIYLNQSFRQRFRGINENLSLNEIIISDEFENQIFNSLLDALRYGNNIYNEVITDPKTASRITVNGSIVRNRNGNSSGAVFVLKPEIHESEASDTV